MKVSGILSTVAVICAVSGSAVAQNDGDGFKGMKMNMIVASEPGGGYDVYARTIARHYPGKLGGSPTIVVQNMPGAGGFRAANHLYTIAPKDGSTLALLQNMSPLGPFYEVEQARFDPTKFNWLGTPSQEVSVLVLWHTVPVNSMADAKAHQLVLGAGGAATGSFYARVLGGVFGLTFKMVQGYGSSGEALLAMERGEIEGYPSIFWSSLKATRGDWIAQNKIKFLVQWGAEAHPELKGVPFANDLVTDPDDKLLMELSSAPLILGRPIAAPPGVPPDRARAMRSALQAVFRDQGYLADCGKAKLECDNPVSGENLAVLIAKTYAAPEPIRRRLVDMYQGDRK